MYGMYVFEVKLTDKHGASFYTNVTCGSNYQARQIAENSHPGCRVSYVTQLPEKK